MITHPTRTLEGQQEKTQEGLGVDLIEKMKHSKRKNDHTFFSLAVLPQVNKYPVCDRLLYGSKR